MMRWIKREVDRQKSETRGEERREGEYEQLLSY